MNKTIHIVGAGGAAGIGMTRCLKEHYDLTGHDTSAYGELNMEVPYAEPWNADLIIPVPDAAVASRYGTSDISFCPSPKQVKICQDKSKTAEMLGDLAPKTYWLRDTEGAGGKGAQMLTGYLPGNNYSQEFVFHEGEMLASFQKLRVSYSVKKKTEGVENVGSSAVSVCTNKKTVLDTALKALMVLEQSTGTPLHGFYGVDLKEDENGVPRVTEINAGRLLTASYSYFWLTGYNLPLIGASAYLGDATPPLPDYPVGVGIIRQIDQLPRLIQPSETESWTR